MPATSPTTDIDSRVAQILGLDFTDDFTPGEYSTLLKEAMVRQHPDHGGDAEVFKLLSAERSRTKQAKEKFRIVRRKIGASSFTSPKGLLGPANGIGKSPIGDVEEEIHEPLDEILRLLREEHKLEKDAAAAARKKAEDDARAKKEKNLERWEALKKTTSAVVKPFRSLWDQIWGFLSKVLLGNILLKIVNWMGDPKNQEKIRNIFRFLKDWWPALLTAYIAFGTGLGRFVTGLAAKLVIWTGKLLLTVIPQLTKALISMGPLGWKAAAVLGTGAAIYGMGKMMGKGEETKNISEAVTTGVEDGGANQVDVERALPQGVDTGVGSGLSPIDTIRNEAINPLGPNVPNLKFNQGGQVPGSGNRDTVPAMLTPGEFVMTKGAVQKYGENMFAGMNAAAGGPVLNTPVHYYANGGKVASYQELVEKGGTVKDHGNIGGERIVEVIFPPEKKGLFGLFGRKTKEKRVMYSSTSEVDTSIEKFLNSRLGGGSIAKPKSTDKPQVGDKVTDPLILADLKKERSIGVNPPVKQNPIIQTAKIQNLQTKNQVAGDPGTKVPYFDAEKYVSTQKIATLGMTV